MGADIHIEVEIWHDNRWHNVADAVPESFITPKFRDGTWATCVSSPESPLARNYHVFGFLAGVRNRDNLPALFADRGLPEGVDGDPDGWDGEGSPPQDYIDLGDHSRTWATLSELLAAPWDMGAETGGWVEYAEWREWLTRRAAAGTEGWREWPKSWCLDVGGGGTQYAEASELHALRDLGEAREAKVRQGDSYARLYVRDVRDRWTCRPVAESRFRRWLRSPVMERLGEKFGADNVRILMGFDS